MLRFYPTAYYGPRTTLPGLRPGSIRKRLVAKVDGWDRAFARRHPDPLLQRLREIYEPKTPASRLLDYGCGSPAFLDEARRRGWLTTGADVSEEVLAEVAASGHDAVRAEPSALEGIGDGTLTLVRLNHVIEHLYHPRDVISALHRKLEPGGLIHLSTPNPDSYAARTFRTFWLGLDCPRHVLLYPPPTLAALLREIGFRTVEIHQEVLTKDATRSLGHTLHGFGLIPHERILAMAEKELLDAILRIPARVAAARGAADRFHCIAAA